MTGLTRQIRAIEPSVEQSNKVVMRLLFFKKLTTLSVGTTDLLAI